MLILWDRMFGTFAAERDDEPVIFGVRKPLANWNPFWANVQVYDYLLYDALRTRRWRDKLGIWFRRTGWRPADVEAAHPKGHSDLAKFKKFDPRIGTGMRRYVMFQFIAAILMTLLISKLYVGGGLRAVSVLCLLLWTQLYALGQLNQGRPNAHALMLEMLRLVAVNGLGVLALNYSEFSVSATGWIWASLYTATSLLWVVALKTPYKTASNVA